MSKSKMLVKADKKGKQIKKTEKEIESKELDKYKPHGDEKNIIEYLPTTIKKKNVMELIENTNDKTAKELKEKLEKEECDITVKNNKIIISPEKSLKVYIIEINPRDGSSFSVYSFVPKNINGMRKAKANYRVNLS